MKASAIAATALIAVTGAVGQVVKRQQGSLPPVTTRGNAFYAGGERFYVRGVAYQPGGAADAADPMLDMEGFRRDVARFQELGINTIRIYTVDNSENHDEAMQMLDDAGIYLALDANTPDYSLNRDSLEAIHQSYNDAYLQNVFATIDAFAGYNNLFLFFSGNEVINEVNNTDTAVDENNTNLAPYIKAVTRDMKRYIGAQVDRQIPVGYSAADVVTEPQAQYFVCGDDENARADFFALNDYSWCDPSSFTQSGWDQKVETYSDYPVPLFLSEYGCITNTREWGEVESLYSTNMTGVYSGGLAYEYTVERNEYGLVEVNSNGEIVPNADFDRLVEAFAATDNPTGDGGARDQITFPSSCPSPTDDWYVDTDNLPEIPDAAERYIQNGAGDGPGLDGDGSQWAGAGETSATSVDLSDGVTDSESTGDGSSTNSAGSGSTDGSSGSGDSGSDSGSSDNNDDSDSADADEGAAPRLGTGFGLVAAITFAFMLL